MDTVLTEVEARVLGCLIEKSLTTPEYYPLTMNSLVAACNQKSNRCPSLELNESTVADGVEGLRYTHHLVCQVSTAGSRVPKFKHDVGGKLPLTDLDVALMCELMLRGPQTAGELRTHCRRLCEIESVADVVDAMQTLAKLEPNPMVVQLPPGAGRREPRYAHLLCGEVEFEAAAPAEERLPRSPSARDERLSELEEKVESLQAEVQSLHEAFELFRTQFE